nr:membrane-bound transcription factor site-2 protease isoform X2 [Parasteatoda tepidariorum]
MFYPYLIMMNNFGIVIKPYMMVWRITRLNKAFKSMGQCMPSLLKKWFNIGFYLSFISMFVAFGLLVMPVIRHISGQFVSNDGKEAVISVIPGITTPFHHIIYIVPALIVSVIFHEFGHALAASREKVPVESCGFALALILPVAFVNLDYRRMSICSSKQQLRVYCAGVWHNLVLLLLSLFFVNYAPSVLYPHYQTDVGVTVLNVEKQSSLAHFGGLTKGDVVSSINNCEVRNIGSWFNCLVETSLSPPMGFCSSKKFIKDYGNISHSCINSSDHLFFKIFTDEVNNFICLPARKAIDEATFCRNNSDCLEKLCLMPVLSTNQEKVIKVKRNFQKSVLFIGSVDEFFLVKTSSWVSDVKFPSIELITHLENFFKYLAGICGGLIIMNVIPCYFLDGGHIIEHLLDYTYRFFKQNLCLKRKTYLATRFKIVGLVLLVVNILLGLKNLKVINL